MMHIAYRFELHFIASLTITIVFYFLLQYWTRRNRKALIWCGYYKEHLLLLSALCVAALLPLREPYDIYMGNNTFVKSIFDQISWFLGAGTSAWGLYRFTKKGVSWPE
jgi:putative effector of murein hydrolase